MEKSNQLLREDIREEREETIEEENTKEMNEEKHPKKRKPRDLPMRNSELSKKKRRETCRKHKADNMIL
jgi:hypothetical protein